MATITPQDLISSLNWRYATKQFDPSKKISAQDWDALQQSLILSPSSFGMQPWKFYQIETPAIRAKLRELSWDQSQITDASHLVVIAAKQEVKETDIDAFLQSISQTRGIPVGVLAEYKAMMTGMILDKNFDVFKWTSKQCYIALGFFLSSAATLGIDACPMEGFDPAGYDQVLGCSKEGYFPMVVATAGYRASTDDYAKLKKVRYPAQQIIRSV